MKLELNKTSREDRIFLIERIDQITKMHREIDQKFKPDLKYTEKSHDKESWGFYDYYDILGLTYLEFCGLTEKEVYGASSVKTARLDDKDKDRIKTKLARDLGEELDVTIFGFIPDAINDVILHSKMKAENKVWLLDTLFFFLSLEQDLKELSEKRIGDRLC